MSYFPNTKMDTVISFPRFVDLLDHAYNSVTDVPHQYFLIQLRPGAGRDTGEHSISTRVLTHVMAPRCQLAWQTSPTMRSTT